MTFNKHYSFEEKHAFLSPSGYHWINYDEQKLRDSFMNSMAAERGTKLHKLAKDLIILGQKLPQTKQTLNLYVNDAIGYRMSPEVVLLYSEICFGTADAISFNKDFLRIHDFKSGITPAHMEQLRVYEALFCLEYGFKPTEIKSELRIYQFDDFVKEEPSPDEIKVIMNKIVTYDKIIRDIKEKEGLNNGWI